MIFAFYAKMLPWMSVGGRFSDSILVTRHDVDNTDEGVWNTPFDIFDNPFKQFLVYNHALLPCR